MSSCPYQTSLVHTKLRARVEPYMAYMAMHAYVCVPSQSAGACQQPMQCNMPFRLPVAVPMSCSTTMWCGKPHQDRNIDKPPFIITHMLIASTASIAIAKRKSAAASLHRAFSGWEQSEDVTIKTHTTALPALAEPNNGLRLVHRGLWWNRCRFRSEV